MLTKTIIRMFGRFTKPKISQANNVFQLDADSKTSTLSLMKSINQTVLNNNQSNTFSKQLANNLDIHEKTSVEVASNTLQINGYQSISNKPHTLKQKFNGEWILTDINAQQLSIGYSPSNQHLQYHHSIEKDIPILPQYKFDSKIAYLFNLPEQVTERQIMLELGIRYIKNVTIKYCLLGLPAYAMIQFNSQHHLQDFVLSEKKQFLIENKLCPMLTSLDADRLDINRRKLVLTNLQESQPSQILLLLSRFGKVMYFDMPTQLHREPSLKQIKQLYKNEEYPVKLRIHRKNGQVETQYYPPIKEEQLSIDLWEKKKKQYTRRLKYSECIDVYEEKQGEIAIKPKGYCFVTFSTEEQAKSCYLQLRTTLKMDLVNERQQFMFDKKHKTALLRFIDNEYVGMKMEQEIPYEQPEEYTLMGRIYLKLLRDQLAAQPLQYSAPRRGLMPYHSYRMAIDKFLSEIGKGHDGRGNRYSKSFDDLVEEELYGKESKKSLNFEDYDKKFVKEFDGDRFAEGTIDRKQYAKKLQNIFQTSFSTAKAFNIKSRPKTLEERARSHIKYNEYVKDVINSYMGIFSDQKLQAELHVTAPTFINPQNLRYLDGTQYLTEPEVQKVLMYSRNGSQELYHEIMSQNEIVKSYNMDVEQTFLKGMDDKIERTIHMATDVGVIEETYKYKGKNIEEDVKALNRTEAQFGEEYKVVTDKHGNQTIAKVAKLDHIAPINAVMKVGQMMQTMMENYEFTEKDRKKFEIYHNNRETIFSGKPLPKDVAEELGLQAGKPYPLQQQMNQLSELCDVNLKDLECLYNLRNYTAEQIADSIKLQMMIQEQRQKYKADQPSDYSRDPSEIEIKGKDGKWKVSKFRQI